jgi:hypothetical protein
MKTQGEPFVGRAGQLLNNMIKAMGIEREQVYIANIVKCRPPGNRTAGARGVRNLLAVSDAADCGGQAESDRGPRSAIAAKTLLAMNASMMQLRGRFYDFRPREFAATIPIGMDASWRSPIIRRFCCAIRGRRAKHGRICRW